MSPAASLLKHYRIKRKYQQKYAAYLLSVDQSYLSGIENGFTGVNWHNFKAKVASAYELTEMEIDELDKAIKLSHHKITLPLNMPAEKFEVAHEFIKKIESMDSNQLELIRARLLLDDLRVKDDSLHRISRGALMKLALKFEVSFSQ